MMIQNAPAGEARFISTMAEHNDLCAQFVHAFGNDIFERPEPFDEMAFVVGHHDRGWDAADAVPHLDSKTGMPCGLGTARAPEAIETNRLSPDFNEAYHPYCGLLSSMHSWGLYNARYGFSEFRVRPGGSASVPVDDDTATETGAMLTYELDRQARLRGSLAADEATRGWIEEKHLAQNYKQLQFFDTLALYFNLRHESARGEEIYVHVPMSEDEDATVTLRPEGDGAYSLDPFPFAGNVLEATCHGRYLAPIAQAEAPEDLGASLRALPTDAQVHRLMRR